MFAPDFESISSLPVLGIMSALERKQKRARTRQRKVSFAVPLVSERIIFDDHDEASENKKFNVKDLERQLVKMAKTLEKEVRKIKEQEVKKSKERAEAKTIEQIKEPKRQRSELRETHKLEKEVFARISNISKSSGFDELWEKVDSLKISHRMVTTEERVVSCRKTGEDAKVLKPVEMRRRASTAA